MASAALECPCLPQIVVGEKRRAWYHFVTTLCAIVGGVFVVAGMLDGLVHGSHALLKRKLDLGVPRAPSPPPLPSPHQFHADDEQYVCSGGIKFFPPWSAGGRCALAVVQAPWIAAPLHICGCDGADSGTGMTRGRCL